MFTLNETLALLRQGTQNLFEKSLSNPDLSEDPILRLAKVTTSTKLQETYPIDLMSIVFREWKGARRFRNAGEIFFTIRNKPFESSIAFDRDQYDDNDLAMKLGDLSPRFNAAFMSKQADAVAQLLNNGHSQVCFDGQYFFDTDHPVDDPTVGGSQQNYWSSGKALTRDNLIAVENAMRSRPAASDASDILMVNPRVLVVPLALRAAAEDILNTTEIVDGGGNRIRNSMFGRYELIVSPRLTDPAAWILWDPNYTATIVQVRKQVEIIKRDDPKLDNMFHHKRIEVGADGRFGAGYGMWQGIAKAKA